MLLHNSCEAHTGEAISGDGSPINIHWDWLIRRP
jgi:hypothetical protein